jgi:hypothetical protein
MALPIHELLPATTALRAPAGHPCRGLPPSQSTRHGSTESRGRGGGWRPIPACVSALIGVHRRPYILCLLCERPSSPSTFRGLGPAAAAPKFQFPAVSSYKFSNLSIFVRIDGVHGTSGYVLTQNQPPHPERLRLQRNPPSPFIHVPATTPAPPTKQCQTNPIPFLDTPGCPCRDSPSGGPYSPNQSPPRLCVGVYPLRASKTPSPPD